MKDTQNCVQTVADTQELTLQDLSNQELIRIIFDLHSKIKRQDLDRLRLLSELEGAKSLAQRYRTRLERTQEGHADLVTDAVMDALSAPPATVPVMTSLHYLDNVEKAA